MLTRRQLLAVGLVLGTTPTAGLLLAGPPDKRTYDLHPVRKPGELTKVQLKLEVAGKLGLIPDDTTEAPKAKEDAVKWSKLAVTAQLAYEEKLLSASGPGEGVLKSVRYYTDASVKITRGDHVANPVLRPERRLIAVRAEGPLVTAFSPAGPLSRDELDLITPIGNSLLLDNLLPDHAVAIGDSWKHGENLLTALLEWDTVTASEVQSTLTQIVGNYARAEFSGRAEGREGGPAPRSN